MKKKGYIERVPHEEIKIYWDVAAPMIDKSLRRTNAKETPNDILKQLYSGDSQLWFGYNKNGYPVATIVTRILEYNYEKIFLYDVCGGTALREWFHDVGKLEEFARSEGCKYARLLGRRGWLKLFGNDNFKEEFVVMRKDY